MKKKNTKLMIAGLIAAGLVGFYLYKRKKKTASKAIISPDMTATISPTLITRK